MKVRGDEPARLETLTHSGELKFNPLLEWLQSRSSDEPSAENAPKAQKTVRPPRQGLDDSAGDASAKRRTEQQAKLEEAERRDAARRAKAAQAPPRSEAAYEEDRPSSTDDAPAPEAGEGVEEMDIAPSDAAEEVAQPEPADDGGARHATETAREHIEL